MILHGLHFTSDHSIIQNSIWKATKYMYELLWHFVWKLATYTKCWSVQPDICILELQCFFCFFWRRTSFSWKNKMTDSTIIVFIMHIVFVHCVFRDYWYYNMCTQRRLSPVCASTHSDRHLSWALWITEALWFLQKTAKTNQSAWTRRLIWVLERHTSYW